MTPLHNLACSLNSLLLRTPVTVVRPSLRYLTGERVCRKHPFPRCSKENLAKSECMTRSKPTKRRVNTNPLVKTDKCAAVVPCQFALPRFDDLYYRPSNKFNKVYEQTWADCPRLRIRPKKVCCFEDIKWPQQKKRKYKQIEKAKSLACTKFPIPKQARCPRVLSEGCRLPRSPPSCKIPRKITCKRMKTPRPPFSECDRDYLKSARPTECRCLEPVITRCPPGAPVKMHPNSKYVPPITSCNRG